MIWLVESNSTEPLEKICMEAKNFMSSEKNLSNVGEKIQRLGAKISAGCLFYDLTPGGEHDMSETFSDFIDLIVYCNENKLFHERDDALKKIQRFEFI